MSQRQWTFIRFAAALVATVTGAGIGGCGAIDNAFDCNAVCSRYRDCVDTTYDVAACRTRCDSKGNGSAAGRSEVNRCEACLNGMSCVGSAFQCGVQCSGIAP